MSKEMDLIVTDLIDWYENFDGDAPILKRAADVIEELRAANERLQALLDDAPVSGGFTEWLRKAKPKGPKRP